MARDESADRWIGRAMTRREDHALVQGAGRYTDDLAAQDCLHLVVFRSPVAAARIRALDLDAARAEPGVLAVFAAADLPLAGASAVNPLLPGAPSLPLRLLAEDRIGAAGEPVAAVVAESLAAARAGAEAVGLDIEPDPAPATRHTLAPFEAGGTRDALAAAVTRVSVRIAHGLVAPFALEPRSALAVPEDGVLRVWLSTQTPFRARDDLEAMLGLKRGEVEVIAPDVGGAFGGKASIMPEDALVAAVALKLGRAVKWTATRSEEFLAATTGRGGITEAEAGLDGDGKLLALDADLTFPLGTWMPYSALAPANNTRRMLPGPYQLDRVSVALDLVASDMPAVNIYRGAGRPEAVMLMERLMDKAALQTGLDPFEIRRRNLLAAAEFPRKLPTGAVIDAADPAALLDRLEETSGYPGLRARQAERRAAGEIVGLGLALYVEPCGQGWESARLELLLDGSLVADTGATAQGQGRETTLAQVIADEMGVAPEAVEVREGDTRLLGNGIGALASRSTAIGASAMLRAARALRQRIVEELAGLQIMQWPGLEVAAQALAGAGKLPLSVEETYTAAGEAWASGAVLAEMSIDRETGVPCLEGVTWVDDAGVVVNPLLARGQLVGGMAQGIGTALLERLVHDDDGQLLTGSLMDYALPRATDMPARLQIEKLATATPANELGAKGVGEAGCIGVPAAILNAAQDAVAPFTRRDLALPLTAETLWRAINGMEERE